MYFWVVDIATGEVVHEYLDMLEAAAVATMNNEENPDSPGWAVMSSARSKAERMAELE